jgi:hypothetical protein
MSAPADNVAWIGGRDRTYDLSDDVPIGHVSPRVEDDHALHEGHHRNEEVHERLLDRAWSWAGGRALKLSAPTLITAPVSKAKLDEHERTYGLEEVELKEVGEARGSQSKIDDAPEGLADKWMLAMMVTTMRIKGTLGSSSVPSR